MKKSVIIFLIILVIVILTSIFYSYYSKTLNIDTGKSCGDLGDKEFANKCCEKRNVNTVHILCTGNWTFIEGKQRGSPEECQFICS